MRHGIHVLEDACQAHGAERDGLRAGAESLAGAFSFYPAKNLGAVGDAGALVTDDVELADRVRALREHGQTEKYKHVTAGFTARMDTLQAIVLKHKLPHLDSWNDARRSAARFYTRGARGRRRPALPPVPEGSKPVWHLYVIRTADPEAAGRASWQSEASRRAGTIRSRRTSRPPTRTSATRRARSRSQRRSRARACRCRSIPGISEQQLTSVVEAISASSPAR